MEELIWIALLVIMVGFWWNAIGAKEAARLAGKQKCVQLDVQFLDDTVVLKKLYPCRHAKGYMQICRVYHFEFSSDGDERYQGQIYVTGELVSKVEMDAYRIP